MNRGESWSSDKGPPPAFTLLSNGVIEHLLERGYYLVVYWFDSGNGRVVSIDISQRHAIFPEFPGPSIGRVECQVGSPIAKLYLVGEDPQPLDLADPKSFDSIDAYFLTVSGRHGP